MPAVRGRTRNFVFVASLVASSAAASESADRDPADANADGTKAGVHVVPLPALSYSRETSLLFGGMAIVNISSGRKGRKDSQASTLAVYTLRSQVAVVVGADAFVLDDALLISTEAAFSRFPASYFGAGNDTRLEDEERYTPQAFAFVGTPALRLTSNTYLGPEVGVSSVEIREVEENRALASGGVPGTEGGLQVAAGAHFRYDSRDKPTYPYRGVLVDWVTLRYDEAMGSDYAYWAMQADARGYVETWPAYVLALRAVGLVQAGRVPFYALAQLGGSQRMRGHFEGRFRDKNGFVLQTEYRIPPVWWRLGFAVFGAAGQVSPTLGAFRLDRMHYSGGGGVRVLLERDARVNVRVDMGFSEDDHGLYINLGEAF